MPIAPVVSLSHFQASHGRILNSAIIIKDRLFVTADR
ncbi:MAG: hypothetical protein RLZZ435_824 [Cyanobacteriota bacterium]|jgi:hypothetical protein